MSVLSCVRLSSSKMGASRGRADCRDGRLLRIHANNDGSLGLDFGDDDREWTLVLGADQMAEIDRERLRAGLDDVL